MLPLCFFLACTRSGENQNNLLTPRPGGDADGMSGRKITLTYENARVRCGYREADPGKYSVLCQAAIVDPAGNELLATEIAPELTLRWSQPEVLEGATQSMSCVESSLSQSCDVALGAGGSAKIEFYLSVTNGTDSKTESDTVLLPYSVSTFGLVPQAPILYSKITEGNPSAGFQSVALDPQKVSFTNISSVCAVGEKIYFAADSFVYLLEKDKVTLFAGSPNPANKDEFSSRLRLYLFTASDTLLACRPEAIYLTDPRFSGRNLKISQEGPVQVMQPTPEFLAMFPALEARLRVIANVSNAYGSFVMDNGSTLVLAYTATGKGIFLVDPKGTIRQIIGQRAVFTEGESATTTVLPHVHAMSADMNGNLFIAHLSLHRVMKIDKDGKISTFAGTGTRGTVGDGGPAVSAQLNYPKDVVASSSGSIYILEDGRIRVIDPAGIISTFAENIATQSIALGPDGAIYFAAYNSPIIQKLDAAGVITTVAGNGISGFSGDGGLATAAQLGGPFSVEVGRDGSIYIPDHNRIRKVDPLGIISTIAEGLVNARKLALGENGKVYFIQSKQVYGLEPVLGVYRLSHLAGGKSAKDCGTGVIENAVAGKDVESQLHASLTALCHGVPWALAFADNCSGPSNQGTLYYSQYLDLERTVSNIIKVTYPCR